MHKDTHFALNDIMDALDGIVAILRELNPGAQYGHIEFYLDRTTKRLEEIAVRDAAETRS